MIGMHINLDGDNAWPDLAAERAITHLTIDWRVAVLPEGLGSGLPSVALRLDLDEVDALRGKDRTIVAETSAANVVALAGLIAGRYPEHFVAPEGTGPQLGLATTEELLNEIETRIDASMRPDKEAFDQGQAFSALMKLGNAMRNVLDYRTADAE